MSVAVAVRKGVRIALATDSQTSFGSSRVPAPNLRTNKIHEVGQSLLATTGWGLYENILEDFLIRHPETELGNRQSVFSFFLGFWKELHDQYPFVKDQCDKEDESPFGSLDASFLIVNPVGIFYIGTDMSVTFGCAKSRVHQAATPQQVGGSLPQILKIGPFQAFSGYE